ncbi:MAG: hypothetical protein UY96_C0010G0016 [Parcubacteria group bacterium GW2011_GWB1_56_8]|nr:MAG: hypothetical protein UY96_C0010G0016 [Parcubacteria group bacterium GW2011_GWB1_56_8]
MKVRDWMSPVGRRWVERVDGGRVFIATEGERFSMIIRESELESEIRRDEANVAYRLAVRQKANEEAERISAIQLNLHHFVSSMSQLKASRVESALVKTQGFSGRFMPRYLFIEEAVAAGATVEDWPSGRRFVLPGGSYYTERDITAIAFDYAEFLLGH